jgi:hypothetical protein
VSPRELYTSAVKLVGGDEGLANASFAALCASGEQPRRFFHTTTHYLNVAAAHQAPLNNVFQAVRFLAGCHHDVAYVHIDQKDGGDALHPAIKSAIETFGSMKFHNDGALDIHFAAHSDPLLQAVNIVFGFTADAQTLELKWYNNQNEYLSALFSLANGLAGGIKAKYLLAQAALIEATVPFGAPDRLLKLRERLIQANERLDDALNAYDIDATMAQAEEMGNTDVGDFEKPFEVFIANSFLLLLENSMGSVSVDNADRIDPVLMATAMSGMSTFLSFVADNSEATPPSRAVFHCVDGTRHNMESHAIENIRQLNRYLRAASTDLQLLINDYVNHHAVSPANWGEVCRHLGTVKNAHPQAAQQFFEALGIDVLKETQIATSFKKSTQEIHNHLNRVKKQAAHKNEDYLGNTSRATAGN